MDDWQESVGSLVYHALQLQKGINIKDHLLRAKKRIIQLEMLLGTTAEEKKANMTMKEAFWIVYNKLPYGQFSGTKFAKQVIFITGRLDAHKDSVLRKLREFRDSGEINCINIDAPAKSIYEKRKTLKDIEAEKKPNVFNFMEE